MPDDDRATPANNGALFPPCFSSAQEFLAAVGTSTGSMIAFFGTDERIRYVNWRYARWFNLRPDEVLGRSLIDLYGIEAYTAFRPMLRRAYAGEFVRYERELKKPDGTAAWISVNMHAHRDHSGCVNGVFATSQVVDELKRTHDALDAALQVQAIYMDNSPLAVIEWNNTLEVRRWSGQAEAIFGWKSADIVGLLAVDVDLVHPDWLPTVRAATKDLIDGRVKHNRMISRNRTKSGRFIFCEWFNSTFIDGNGKTHGILSLAQDVTLRVEAEEQLRFSAVHDALTGLQNRQSLISRLDHALVRAARSGAYLALLFIDLDKFKAVNDTHGHATGDELLRQVASRLKTCTRDADTVARIGGDEFVVLLESELDADTPEIISARIADSFAQGFTLGEKRISTGASIGISRFPVDGNDADQLMASADRAMYRAKHSR
jgi:diguanylate cyclase (GGDEF)-like protein/PAS domain S-box-containing protein